MRSILAFIGQEAAFSGEVTREGTGARPGPKGGSPGVPDPAAP